MEPLIVLAVTFVLLWVLFILPQQRRVRAHQALVTSLQTGDEVVLSAGIHGRITDLGPDEMLLEVAPGVELRVARQAVLRLVEHASPTGADTDETGRPGGAGIDPSAGPTPEPAPDDGAVAPGTPGPHDGGPTPGPHDRGPTTPDPDDRGPTTPGPDV
jgi:preprotein translocase subunit YajC